jgi:VIT1/CCC1 family predicted Fe2+/Mn2+ transporter
VPRGVVRPIRLSAILPILPFVPSRTWRWQCAAVSAVGLFGIGAAITLLTGRSVLMSGGRQLAFGAAAFAVTYGIGALFGTVVG